mmetsp:Transcript_56045/g.163765  ORF Transcript_56045/g.163765 Transcript_56045/m.163765 type:complete len:220 (+) Transcript_56045:317-976(+)
MRKHKVVLCLLCRQTVSLHKEGTEQCASTAMPAPAVDVDLSALAQLLNNGGHCNCQVVPGGDVAVRHLAVQELELAPLGPGQRRAQLRRPRDVGREPLQLPALLEAEEGVDPRLEAGEDLLGVARLAPVAGVAARQEAAGQQVVAGVVGPPRPGRRAGAGLQYRQRWKPLKSAFTCFRVLRVGVIASLKPGSGTALASTFPEYGASSAPHDRANTRALR